MKSSRKFVRRVKDRAAPCGYSLLEVLAVVTVLGILGLAAVAGFRPETVGNVGAKVNARRVALDLMQARRRSIATGDNHFLDFQTTGGATTYQVIRRFNSGTMPVDEVRFVPPNIAVSITPLSPEFNFEGQALSSYVITLTATDPNVQNHGRSSDRKRDRS